MKPCPCTRGSSDFLNSSALASRFLTSASVLASSGSPAPPGCSSSTAVTASITAVSSGATPPWGARPLVALPAGGLAGQRGRRQGRVDQQQPADGLLVTAGGFLVVLADAAQGLLVI